MKRIWSILLCAALLLGCGCPALAAEEAEQIDREAELTEIAASVKELLGIDDDYTSFHGDRYDGLRPGWFLNWSDASRELSVNCDDSGVVTELYRWKAEARYGFYGFDAAFPVLTEAEARSTAEQWLGRLLAEGESARIDDHTVALRKAGEHVFRGRILRNDLETPIRFDITIGEDGLTGFNRSDSYKTYVGEVPDPEPQTSPEDAASLLAEAVRMELYYVAEEGGEARLRYVPVGPYTLVDAQSGEAVDMDARYTESRGWGYGEEEAAVEASAKGMEDRGLTEVELSAISQYAGILEREALDDLVRQIPQLGLEDFSLQRCAYVSREGGVAANLTYASEMTAERLFGFSPEEFGQLTAWGDRAYVYKYVTADAKTGQLMSVSTSYPLWREPQPGADPAMEETAKDFLEACVPEMFKESGICALKCLEGRSGFTFARTHEGYFYPANTLQVTLNEAMGTVDEFSYEWDADMSFAAAEGILEESEAIAAYAAARNVTLGYAAWPEGIDYSEPTYQPYLDYGYTWVESLRLGYYYDSRDMVSGVDALTGEPLGAVAGTELTYDDIEAETRRDVIETLGAAGIGFAGGSFLPEEPLTVRDGAVLLLQAQGYDLRGWDEDSILREAISQGFVPGENWQPVQGVTGMEFVRMILGPSRYGAAAALEGIWADTVPETAPEDMGYAAVAQALGMTAAQGWSPEETCTRADGAELLYLFMVRPAA